MLVTFDQIHSEDCIRNILLVLSIVHNSFACGHRFVAWLLIAAMLAKYRFSLVVFHLYVIYEDHDHDLDCRDRLRSVVNGGAESSFLSKHQRVRLRGFAFRWLLIAVSSSSKNPSINPKLRRLI